MHYLTLPSAVFFLAFQTLHALNIIHSAETKQLPNTPARVTEAPLGIIEPLELLLGHGPGLKPRAETEDSAIIVTIAPDETCGYVDGDLLSAVTCPSSSLCSWAALSGTGMVACGAQIYILCVESSIAVNSTRCDDVCQSNTFYLKCTNSNRPFCRTYVYPSGIFDYRCASTASKNLERVEFTFEGQNSLSLSTVTLTDEVADGQREPVTVTVQGKATGSPSAVTIYMIPQPPSQTTTLTETSSSSNKSTPVGAIVGGVVGGVAVLGLIGLGAFFLVRRQKKSKHEYNVAGQPIMTSLKSQNQYPYHPQHGAVPPYNDPTSPSGQNAHGGGTQLPHSIVQSPAPTFEMEGTEARMPEPVYEMGVDSSEGR